MEISLKSVYAINPRRIIYIEYYMAPVPTRAFIYEEACNFSREEDVRFNPDSTSEIPIEIEVQERDLRRTIYIHMTDNEKLEFTTKDNTLYEELKGTLQKIVGE